MIRGFSGTILAGDKFDAWRHRCADSFHHRIRTSHARVPTFQRLRFANPLRQRYPAAFRPSQVRLQPTSQYCNDIQYVRLLPRLYHPYSLLRLLLLIRAHFSQTPRSKCDDHRENRFVQYYISRAKARRFT